MNRLDEIEREHSAVLAAYTTKGCGPEIDPEGEQCTARDVLALVAVARAVPEVLAYEPEHCACGDPGCTQPQEAWRTLRAALAPLLQETSADAGEGR